MTNMDEFESLTAAIIGAAIEVHCHAGPGLLESGHEECLPSELMQKASLHTRAVQTVENRGRVSVDMLINDAVIRELKCMGTFQPVHAAQVLTYLKMTGLRPGLSLNFKVDVMRKGIKRVVNTL
ncbi:MAG TPA: GxxExxY protein [Burkholderiales bacterium]